MKRRQLFGRAPTSVRLTPAFYRARLPQLKAALTAEGGNLIQHWGTRELPSDKISASYAFTNYILGELRERYGPGLMRRYRELLHKDLASTGKDAKQSMSSEQRDAVVIDRLGRAAGADLRPLFMDDCRLMIDDSRWIGHKVVSHY